MYFRTDANTLERDVEAEKASKHKYMLTTLHNIHLSTLS
jgi:hypothetical protein